MKSPVRKYWYPTSWYLTRNPIRNRGWHLTWQRFQKKKSRLVDGPDETTPRPFFETVFGTEPYGLV
jgi:hypothetical protein